MAGVGKHLGRRGISAKGDRSEWASLESFPASATSGTDTTPVVTETYISEVYIANNCDLTGVKVLNGSAVGGNIKAGLFDSAGTLVAQSASTAQAGIATLQTLAFTATAKVKGPQTYYVGLQCSSTSARFRSHAIGVMGASKKTGETYGTFTNITAPTTFTADQGPVLSTY
jgi:hypothetical protein